MSATDPVSVEQIARTLETAIEGSRKAMAGGWHRPSQREVEAMALLIHLVFDSEDRGAAPNSAD